MARDKSIMVGDVRREGEKGGVWEISFNRQALDWDLESSIVFYDLIYGITPPRGEDRLRWRGDKSGSFSVKSYYERLLPRGGIEGFPWKLVWQEGVPMKVFFFVWELVCVQVHMIDN